MTPVRASALLCGAIFGLGLVISQMALPAKVSGFLDVAGLWDPSLLFVLGAAVLVTNIAFPVIRRRRTPLCDTAFEGVPAERVDARLLAGAAVFGVGWGLPSRPRRSSDAVAVSVALRPFNTELRHMTSGRGPDACLDAVGMEAHAGGNAGSIEGLYDHAKQLLKLEPDRPPVVRDAIVSVRNGGSVSLAGVYGGLVDKIPLGFSAHREG